MLWIEAGAVVFVIVLAFVWMGFALGAVLRKLDDDSTSAWVPVYRYVVAARAGDLPTAPVWVARSVAAVCWVMFGVVVLLRGSDAMAASAGLAAVALLAFVMAFLGSLFGWVVWILGASRIESRLGVQSRLSWLAALVPPLWASVVGFGSASPIVAGVVQGQATSEPPSGKPDDDATRAIPRVVTDTPKPASASGTANPAPASDLSESTVAPTPPTPVEAAMTTEERDVTGELPRAYSPYDRVDQPALVAAAQPWDPDDDDDQTFYAKRRRARWVLRIAGGDEYDLEDVTTIGREGIRPIPGVLSIIDDTRTMSKLHARLRRGSDTWYVTDLGSTNGTFVRDAAGIEFEVEAQTEKKIEGTLLLGDLEAVIVDQRDSA